MNRLVRCPLCELWTLPVPDEAFCPTHGPIPYPGRPNP